MGFEDTKTEFFGPRRRGSWSGRAGRGRARREARQIEALQSSDPGERLRAATTLVEQGIDSNAGVVLDFVRDERNRDLRSAVSRAVLTAPIAARPAEPEAKLRDWARAEVTRHEDPPPAPPPTPAPPAVPPPAVAPPAVAPPAVAPPVAPVPPAPPPTPAPLVPVGGTIPGVLSPDDRWRVGAAVSVRLGSTLVASPPPPPLPPPPPVAPAPPPVVGGTIGNGSKPNDVIVRRTSEGRESSPRNEEHEEREAETPQAQRPIPLAAPARPTGPATWRVVKAHPVDIVVWEPADEVGDAAPGEEIAQSEPSITR
jgi:hypothetical protein